MGAYIATVKPMNCLACTFLHKAAILVPGLGVKQKSISNLAGVQ